MRIIFTPHVVVIFAHIFTQSPHEQLPQPFSFVSSGFPDMHGCGSRVQSQICSFWHKSWSGPPPPPKQIPSLLILPSTTSFQYMSVSPRALPQVLSTISLVQHCAAKSVPLLPTLKAVQDDTKRLLCRGYIRSRNDENYDFGDFQYCRKVQICSRFVPIMGGCF